MTQPGEIPPRPPATPSAQRREAEAGQTAWAEQNLGSGDVEELRERGLTVERPPGIDRDVKYVNLRDGSVDVYQPAEDGPQIGAYVRLSALERYCDQHGMPIEEIDGTVSLLPVDER